MKVQLEQRRQVTGEKERERWKVGHILISPPERYCRMQHTSIWNLHVIGINYESVSYLFIYKIFDYTSHVFYPFLLEWCCKCVCKIVWAVYISYSWIFVATASQTWVVSYCILALTWIAVSLSQNAVQGFLMVFTSFLSCIVELL